MPVQNDVPLAKQPRVVLAYADSTYAALCCRYFRRQGVQVHLASSGTEARRLARTLAPGALVLDTKLHDESGWLTCAKLVAENGGVRVVLVAPELNRQSLALADFVGASALVPREAGAEALADEVLGPGCAEALAAAREREVASGPLVG